MGEIIVINSNDKFSYKAKVISSIIRGFSLNVYRDKSILIMCANRKKGTLLNFFGVNPDETNIEDLVSYKIIAGLEVKLKELLARKGNLYFLGSLRTIEAYFNELRAYYLKVLYDLKKNFDVIFVDSAYDDSFSDFIKHEASILIDIVEGPFDSIEVNVLREGLYLSSVTIDLTGKLKEVKSMEALDRLLQIDANLLGKIDEIVNIIDVKEANPSPMQQRYKLSFSLGGWGKCKISRFWK